MPTFRHIAGRNVGYSGTAGTSEERFRLDLPIAEWLDKEPELHEETLVSAFWRSPSKCISVKKKWLGRDDASLRERRHAANSRLSVKEHLAAMDYLRQGIHLRGYARKIRSRNTNVNRSPCLQRC